MANNGYRQGYPSEAPPPQRFPGQIDQRGPRRQQPPPQNNYPRNQEYNGNQQYNVQNGYTRGDQYGDGSYLIQQQQNGYHDPRGPTGYHNQDRYDGQQGGGYYENVQQYEQQQYPAQDRTDRAYQYDDRFRRNGQQRPGPQHQQSVGPVSGQTSRPNLQRLDTGRPRERERILNEPESPKTIPWDNPFGAFPTKKKQEDVKARNSTDEQSNKLRSPDTQAVLPNSRPATSHGPQQRDDQLRPATSHGQRQQVPLTSPPVRYEEMPFRGDRPIARQENGATEEFGSAGHAQRPLPQRSMTAPAPQDPPYNRRPMPQQQQPHFVSPNHVAPMRQQTYNEFPQQRLPDAQIEQDFERDRADPTRQAAPQYADSRYARQQVTNDYDQRTQSFREQNIEDEMTYRGVPISKKISPDVSGFDTTTFDRRMRSDAPTSAGSQSQQGLPYRKPTYQTAGPPRSSTDTQRERPPLVAEQLVEPLSQFAFGVPANTPQSPRTQHPIHSPSHQLQDNARTQSYRNAQDLPFQQQQSSMGAQTSPSYHPPREASRGNMGAPTANNAYSFPPTPTQARAEASNRPSFDQSNPQRSNGSYGQSPDQYHETQRSRNYSDLIPVDETQTSLNEYDRAQHRTGYDSRLPVRTDSAPPQQSQQVPPRPRTSSSNQPPAIGHGRRISAETFRSNMTGRSNPDSLPPHPVPVRPGLMQPTPQSPAAVNNSQPHLTQKIPAAPPVVTNKPAPVTIQELNMLRESFKNNPSDHALGLRFAKRLVEAAKVLATDNGRADAKQTAKNRERYVLDAHKIVKKLISAGDAEAMFYMADCYGQGLLGLQPDPKEAFLLYQSAAKAGHAQGAYRVAVCCELGPEEGGGTRRDPPKAVQWYKRAATLGDTPAMFKMGMIQLKGHLGQPRNPREAISWLKRAADRADVENPHALHELALLYESAKSDDVVIRDEKYALQLFTQAAELGYKYSQFRLGSAYEYGLLGCPIDPRMSIFWYSRAAGQGEHQAEFALSGWYLTGSGQPAPGEEPLLRQSDTEAYLWARKAATSGLTKAEYAMGYYTEVGIGVTANLEEAKKWYFRAAAQNFPKARERLEDLKRGGGRMQKTRVSRSNVGKQNEGECIVM